MQAENSNYPDFKSVLRKYAKKEIAISFNTYAQWPDEPSELIQRLVPTKIGRHNDEMMCCRSNWHQ